MIIESLFETIKKFTEDDWNDIIYWSESPVFKLKKKVHPNKLEKDYIILFDLIFKEKENLKQLDIPLFMFHMQQSLNIKNSKNSLVNFRNRFGELKSNYFEKFIGLKMISIGASKIRIDINTLRYYSEQGLVKHHKDLSEKILRKITKRYNTGLDYYNLYIHHESLTAYYAFIDFKLSNKHLALSLDYLKRYTILKNLCLNSEIANRMLIYNINIERCILPIIENSILDQNIFIDLQFSIYKLQNKVLNALKKTNKLSKIGENLVNDVLIILKSINQEKISSKIDLLTIYFQLLNVCKVMNQNEMGFSSSFIEIINLLEEKNLLLQHNRLNPNLFKTVIDFCLDNDHKDYAQFFYQKYATKNIQNTDYKASKIQSKAFKKLSYSEKVSLYCQARIYFKKKKYIKALEIIHFLNYTKKEFFDIDLARLSIKVFLELQMADELSNMLRSARGKLKTIQIDLPYKAKEKLNTFISILNTNKFIDKHYINKKVREKSLCSYDRKYLLNKFC